LRHWLHSSQEVPNCGTGFSASTLFLLVRRSIKARSDASNPPSSLPRHLSLIQLSAWKVNSANFAITEF
jgi:hypothetical protein